MKKTILIVIGFLCIINVFAQSPQAFNYQAIVRNASGTVIQDQNVSLRISLLQDSVTGTPVFVETHTAVTNTFGLVNLKIGKGTVVSGNFATIDWSAGLYFIKIEMDVTGGNTFVEMGVSQLLSVPFALYAASGNQGPQGIQGLPGTNGQNGISVIWLGSFTSNPLNPDINQAYYNLTDKKSYIFDGSIWQIIAQDGMQGLQGIQGLSGSNGQNCISVLWLGTFNLHPSTPALNQAYYNSTDKKSYIFDGIDWQILAQDGAQGQTGNDGQNGISVSWLGTFAVNPDNPTLNQAYYNSTDKKSYIFDGIGWQIIAQDGMQGLQGIQGTQGLQGPAGTYIAGAGINISNDTISSVVPAYNAGAGLSLTGTTFNAIFGSVTGTISEGNHTHISYAAGGVNGNLQFNNSGVFGGNNALFWDNNNLRLGIGTSSPTSTLHINGILRIADDTEGAGKILTSDTNGYTSWQLPSNGLFTGTQNRIAKFTSPNNLI